MKRYYSFLILLLLSIVPLPAQDRTGKDIAVFFPVETYRGKWKTLNNPLKEANEISKILHEQYGFQTEIHKNKTLPEILAVLANLLNKKYPEDGQLLIFFSGHGAFNDMTKEGFFIPANASEEHEYLNYETLRKKTDAIPCNHTLLMIDACYSGTFDDAVAYKGEPDEWEEEDLASRIEKELKFKTRYFAASGAKERTPDQSQFAARFIQALRFPPKDGVASLGSIGMEIEKATPKPYMKPFGSDERGNFLFISSNRPEPENPKSILYNQMKPDCDRDFNQGKWEQAKYCYTYLLKYKPNDPYSLQKIRECEQNIGGDTESKYQTALANARYYRDIAKQAEKDNDCVAEKENWGKAKPYYQECLRYKSNDPTGKEGVALCDNQIKDLDCDPDKDGFLGKADKCPNIAGVAPDGCIHEPPPPRDQPDGLILVKGGTYEMGDGFGDGESDEKPTHTVTLSDFYMGQYEVTVSEFEVFVNETGYKTDAEKEGWSYYWDGDSWEKKNGIYWKHDEEGNLRERSKYNYPVIHVSWNDAKAFCDWMSRKYGKTYSLPTEAQWEYAARSGGKKNKYAWGNGLTATNGANVATKNHWSGDIFEGSDSYKYACPVSQSGVNDIGLYGMTGNVWEWCSDWYGTYSSGSQTNPTGASSGSYRLDRGGSWCDDARLSRTSNRYYFSPSLRYSFLGFRLSRTE